MNEYDIKNLDIKLLNKKVYEESKEFMKKFNKIVKDSNPIFCSEFMANYICYIVLNYVMGFEKKFTKNELVDFAKNMMQKMESHIVHVINSRPLN